MYIKLNKDYEVKTTLGTIREIEKLFDKAFLDVIGNIATMKIDEQIRFIFAGVKKANSEMTEKAFSDLCDDYVGMGELMEYLEQYIFALQYPGLSEQEVQDKLEKKLERTQKLSKNKAAKAG